MIVSVICELEAVENRKCYLWDKVHLPDCPPAEHEASGLIARINSMLEAEVSQKNNFEYSLSCLVNAHKSLSGSLWPRCEGGDLLLQQQWYRHDTLVYCGLSFQLMRALRFWLDNSQYDNFPSMCSLAPKISAEDLSCLYQEIGQQYPWFGKLCEPARFIPLKGTMRDFVQMVEQWTDKHPLVQASVGLLTGIAATQVRTMSQEYGLKMYVDSLNEFLTHNIGEMPYLELGRNLLRRLLDLYVDDPTYYVSVLTAYRNSLERQFDKRFLLEEVEYWKRHKPFFPDGHPSWMDVMEELLSISDTQCPGTYEKLEWKGSGEQLAKIVVEWVKSGLIHYKGNGDITPLASQVYRFFKIEKVRGGGCLNKASFVSYIKKENAEVD